MQNNTLRTLKPFGTMCFGLIKQKLKFFTINKEGMLRVKMMKPLLRRTHCQLLNMEVDPLFFGIVWQLGAQEILCEWKEEWIPPNIKTF